MKTDVMNITDLFHQKMGYHVHPDYSDRTQIKLHWTKEEVIAELKDRAQFLVQKVAERLYDGLVVIISCHGSMGNVICSDHGEIPKSYIHRLFSMKEDVVGLRGIPRLFLFDCCDGEFDYDDREQYKNALKEMGEDIQRTASGRFTELQTMDSAASITMDPPSPVKWS